jgi:nucleolar protein 56
VRRNAGRWPAGARLYPFIVSPSWTEVKVPIVVIKYDVFGSVGMETVLRWYGVFVVDGDELVEEHPFSKEEITGKVAHMLKGEWSEIDPRLSGSPEGWGDGALTSPAGNASIVPGPGAYGLSDDDLSVVIADASEIIAQEELRSDDQAIIRIVDALEDIQRAVVLLETRVRDWTTVDGFAGVEDPPSLEALRRSVGEINAAKSALEGELEIIVERCAPNTSRLLGASITASLIARARGLDRLARFPAGTIQILGAEKAFFRHLKGGGRMPKHGFIYQHPWVHRTPRRGRGKAARALAGKTAIAARADHFGGDLGDQLVTAMEKRIADILGEK